VLFPGRERLPFGEGHNPFVISIDNVDALFASHAISSRKKPDEVRVAVIGDSSVWGENLYLSETLTGEWNQLDMQCGGKSMRVYNLGYPHPSAIKDLIFLMKLKDYEPDAIVWLITLNTLTSMRVNPVLIENREMALDLLDQYQLVFSESDVLKQTEKSLFEKTIIGRRSYLARLIKLQALGWLWSATGRDVERLADPVSMSPDVSDNLEYKRLPPGTDLNGILLTEALPAGHEISDGIPILLVNEPMYVAGGLNADVRYNDFYPRWAYDQYRDVISAESKQNDWKYLDLWNLISPEYFTDTALHLSATGERLLAERLHSEVRSLLCN
jgi:uncharacterized protein YbaR (Trm112 family)